MHVDLVTQHVKIGIKNLHIRAYRKLTLSGMTINVRNCTTVGNVVSQTLTTVEEVEDKAIDFNSFLTDTLYDKLSF